MVVKCFIRNPYSSRRLHSLLITSLLLFADVLSFINTLMFVTRSDFASLSRYHRLSLLPPTPLLSSLDWWVRSRVRFFETDEESEQQIPHALPRHSGVFAQMKPGALPSMVHCRATCTVMSLHVMHLHCVCVYVWVCIGVLHFLYLLLCVS